MSEYLKTLSSEQIKTLSSVDSGALHLRLNDGGVSMGPNCIGVTFHSPDWLIVEFDAALNSGEEVMLDTEIEIHTP